MEINSSHPGGRLFELKRTLGSGETQARAPRRPPWRWLHITYALVVLLLVATGLPIQFPDLRARLVGGYGRSIATVHEWGGVAMLALPLLALAWAPSWATTSFRLRARHRRDLGLHAANLWFTLLSGMLLIATGFIMWMPDRLPLPLVDNSAQLHAAASWALYVMLPVHLLVTRQRIWAATREWILAATELLGRAPDGAGKQTEDQACW